MTLPREAPFATADPARAARTASRFHSQNRSGRPRTAGHLSVRSVRDRGRCGQLFRTNSPEIPPDARRPAGWPARSAPSNNRRRRSGGSARRLYWKPRMSGSHLRNLTAPSATASCCSATRPGPRPQRARRHGTTSAACWSPRPARTRRHRRGPCCCCPAWRCPPWPSRCAAACASTNGHNVRERVLDIFFDDSRTFGVYPRLTLESQTTVGVGVRLVHRNLFGSGVRFKGAADARRRVPAAAGRQPAAARRWPERRCGCTCAAAGSASPGRRSTASAIRCARRQQQRHRAMPAPPTRRRSGRPSPGAS